jgi:hypothetical protein
MPYRPCPFLIADGGPGRGDARPILMNGSIGDEKMGCEAERRARWGVEIGGEE